MALSRSPLRPVAILLPVFVGLLPIVHSMLLSRYFMVPQQALLLLALGLLLAGGITGSLRWLRDEPFSVKLALASFSLLVVWLGLSSTLGSDPIRSLISDDFQGTSWIFWVVCLLLFFAAVRFRDELLDGVSRSILIAAGTLLALTFLWAIGGDVVQEFLVPVSREGVPLPGVGNSAFLGAFFGAAALVSLGRWMGPARGSFALLVVAVASFGMVVLTQSRVSMIATSILFLGGAWISRHIGKLRVVSVAIAFLVAGFVVQLFAVPNLAAPGSSAPSASQPGSITATKFESAAVEGGWNVRRGIWGAALNASVKEPLFGVGANNFSYAYRKHATETNIRSAAQGAADEVNDAHSLVLEVAATGGFPAAMALLMMLGAVAWASGNSLRNGDAKTWAGLAALVLLAQGLFQPLSLVSMPLMLIMAGLTLPARRERPDVGRFVPKVLMAAAVVPVVVAATAAGVLMYSDHKLRGASLEWDATMAEAAVNSNPYCLTCLFELGKIRRWDYIKQGRGTEQSALAPNLRAVERHPLDSDVYLELGGGLLFIQQPARALVQFEKALALDPHSWLAGQGTAVALLRLERFAEAVSYLQDSARRNPSAQAYQLLSSTADKAGMTAVAAEAREKAKELSQKESN